MRTLVLLALLAGIAALPALASAEDAQPCQPPYVRAYACFFGSTGFHHATVCGEDVPGVCVPIV